MAIGRMFRELLDESQTPIAGKCENVRPPAEVIVLAVAKAAMPKASPNMLASPRPVAA